MDFWEAQRRARKQTAVYLVLFALLTLAAAFLAELGIRYVAQDQYNPPWPFFGTLFVALTFTVALFQYWWFSFTGGRCVAEILGGRRANGSDLKEAQLLHIVNECAVASSLPVPQTYIIRGDSINAFAAGLSADKAIIAITSGALHKLSREELQGVIAHEFGHIKNGDMRIGLRLAALIMGFYFILYLGFRMLQFSGRSDGGGSRNSGKNVLLLASLVFLCAGALTWLFGSILKACVSRQREYLADASSVQFTRNPHGLANALRKILNEPKKAMPKTGMAYSHLYLDDRSWVSSIFATHPPLQKRIEAIEGHSL